MDTTKNEKHIKRPEPLTLRRSSSPNTNGNCFNEDSSTIPEKTPHVVHNHLPHPSLGEQLLHSLLSLLYALWSGMLSMFGFGSKARAATQYAQSKKNDDSSVCTGCSSLETESGVELLSPDETPRTTYNEVMQRRAVANQVILRRLETENVESLIRSFRVHACTWNVDQQLPPKLKRGFGEWLLGKELLDKVDAYRHAVELAENGVDLVSPDFPTDEFPDLVVASLQEVEMGGVAFVKEHTDTGIAWAEDIVDRLNQLGDRRVFYRKVKMLQLVGLVVIIVTRAEHLNYMTNIRASITRTGAMRGVWGNKGSVGLRATIYGKRFLFIGAHFAAHKSKEQERTYNYRAALSEMCFEMPNNMDDLIEVMHTFNSASGPEHTHIEKNSTWTRLFRRFGNNVSVSAENVVLDTHDYVFFLGDLNSRLHGVKSTDIRRLIRLGEYDRLLCHDELRQGMIVGEIFDGFQEPCILFPPTYKFDRETDLYDTSRKTRDPAWCDRILFRVMLPNNHTGNNENAPHVMPSCASLFCCAKSNNGTDVSAPLLTSADDVVAVSHPGALLKATRGSVGEIRGRDWGNTLPPLLRGCNGNLSRAASETVPTFYAARSKSAAVRGVGSIPFTPNEVRVIGYQFVPCLRQSDHRPVCAQFDVCVLRLRKELVDSIMHDARNAVVDMQNSNFDYR